MSFVRRIRETIRRLAGKERKFELKPPTPSKDKPKFDATWLFVTKTQDPVVGWYYRALLHQKVRAFDRPDPPIQGGTLVWNSQCRKERDAQGSSRESQGGAMRAQGSEAGGVTPRNTLIGAAVGLALSLAAVIVILLWAKVVATVAGFIWGLW